MHSATRLSRRMLSPEFAKALSEKTRGEPGTSTPRSASSSPSLVRGNSPSRAEAMSILKKKGPLGNSDEHDDGSRSVPNKNHFAFIPHGQLTHNGHSHLLDNVKAFHPRPEPEQAHSHAIDIHRFPNSQSLSPFAHVSSFPSEAFHDRSILDQHHAVQGFENPGHRGQLSMALLHEHDHVIRRFAPRLSAIAAADHDVKSRNPMERSPATSSPCPCIHRTIKSMDSRATQRDTRQSSRERLPMIPMDTKSSLRSRPRRPLSRCPSGPLGTTPKGITKRSR